MDWRSITFDWNRTRAFLVTAEEGSYSAAARALGVAQPTIGRQVAALEAELGVALFERHGHRLMLTATGLALVEHARAMGEAANRMALAAAGEAQSLEGTVCVSASEVVATFLLPRAVAEIRAMHPRIQLEIVASSAASDLRRREADIAVRSFRPTQPDLIARKIQDGRARMYASPAYLDRVGALDTVADLQRADFFAFDRSDVMRQRLGQLGLQLSAANFPIVAARQLVQWELAKAGQGICIMMEEIGDREPAMVRVAEALLPPLPVPMYLVSHRELRTSRRVRAVFDLLVAALRAQVTGTVPAAAT